MRWKIQHLRRLNNLPRNSPSTDTGELYPVTASRWTTVPTPPRVQLPMARTTKAVAPVGHEPSIGMDSESGNYYRLQICIPFPRRLPDLGKFWLHHLLFPFSNINVRWSFQHREMWLCVAVTPLCTVYRPTRPYSTKGPTRHDAGIGQGGTSGSLLPSDIKLSRR